MDTDQWSDERTLALTDELTRRGLLELATGRSRQSFATKLLALLGEGRTDTTELADWIVEQPEVIELHGSDEELRSAIRAITGEPEEAAVTLDKETRAVVELLPEGVAADLSATGKLHRDLPQEDGHEIRWIDLHPVDGLKVRSFPIATRDYWLNQDEPGTDPSLEYDVLGIDLVKGCNDYAPTGVLVWFPDLGEFGSWDRDHRIAMTFPGVGWKQIAKDLGHFVNAQWNPRAEHSMLRPWADPRCSQLVPRKK